VQHHALANNMDHLFKAEQNDAPIRAGRRAPWNHNRNALGRLQVTRRCRTIVASEFVSEMFALDNILLNIPAPNTAASVFAGG